MIPTIHPMARLQLVARKKLGFPLGLHFGVYVGQASLGLHDLVIDLSAEGRYLKAPAAFLSGREWWHVDDALPDDNGAAIQRLLQKLGQQERYDLVANNCEDWAREIIHGRKRSTQRNMVVTGLVTWAVISLGKK